MSARFDFDGPDPGYIDRSNVRAESIYQTGKVCGECGLEIKGRKDDRGTYYFDESGHLFDKRLIEPL